MERGSHDTARWHGRLALALCVSLALHLGVMLVPTPTMHHPSLPLRFQNTVELGLEEVQRGSTTPPSAPPAATEPAATPPAPPVARRPRPRRPAAPRPSPSRIPEPEDGTLAAENPADAGALAALDDAGTGPDEDAGTALALADAGAAPRREIPALAGAAPDLAPAVPRGSLVTLLLRTDRLRGNPNGPRVRAMLMGIRDWQSLLGETEIDPVRDFDQVLLASANPFYAVGGRGPDLFALLRLRADRRFVRAAIEQMAGARPPPGAADGGTLHDHFALGDAGALPPAARDIWQRRGGAEVATIERYHARRAFVLLDDDLAAIAAPDRVDALLAVLARRPAGALAQPSAGVGDRAERLVTLLEFHGVRNLVAPVPGPQNPVPRRIELGVFETRETPAAPDGGAELLALASYDTEDQARHAARLMRVFMEAQRQFLDEQSRSLGNRLAAAAIGVDLDHLRAALRAIDARSEGTTLRLEARLSPAEVASLLSALRWAPLAQ